MATASSEKLFSEYDSEIRYASSTTKKISQIKDRLKAARNRQKSYADKRKKPLEFSVGDYVLIKVLPWKGVVHFGKKGNLAPRFVRPFEIIEKVQNRWKGYHAVPPPYTGNFMPPKPNLVLANEEEYVFSESITSVPAVSTKDALAHEWNNSTTSQIIKKLWWNLYSLGGDPKEQSIQGYIHSRTRIVEENLHVKFSEETPNIAGNGPNWLFDIDALTKSMNYEPVVAGNQSNGIGRDPPFSSSSKDSHDAGFKPSREEEKKDAEHLENEDSKVPNIEEPRVNQEQDESVNSTNNINIVSLTVNNASIEDNVVDENKVLMDLFPTPTTRIYKDHLLEQIIGDIHSAPQTRRMTKSVIKHVDLPYGKRAIGTKWIYKNKKDERGIVVRNKARLVAQGYTQEEGIDYDEVFDPKTT
ncbi:putative ribonuclease H-like domain-containing protein [Tanacetum coccineum]